MFIQTYLITHNWIHFRQFHQPMDFVEYVRRTSLGQSKARFRDVCLKWFIVECLFTKIMDAVNICNVKLLWYKRYFILIMILFVKIDCWLFVDWLKNRFWYIYWSFFTFFLSIMKVIDICLKCLHTAMMEYTSLKIF